MIRGTLVWGSFFPDICIPTLVAIILVVIAVSTFVAFVRALRQERRQGERLRSVDLVNLVIALVTAIIAIAGFFTCTERLPDIRISLASSRLNPAAGGQRESPGDEYVCLVNKENDAVSLAGWELRDSDELINVLPDFSLEPGAAVRVHPGNGPNSEGNLYGERGTASWFNEGGQITLLDDEGQEIDHVGYGRRAQNDGSGECAAGAELVLTITGPPDRSAIHSATVTIRGTVTPGGAVYAKIDHDDESESGGEEAQITGTDGLDHFAVDLQLDLGRNIIRVQAVKPGFEPVTEFLGLVRKGVTPPPPPACDPNYKGVCLDPNASDYDCAKGEGDGPEYVEGPVEVVGEDHFDLDQNGDGTACEP